MTLRVSLDFDGVIANPHILLCEMVEKKYGVTITEDDIYQWGLEEVLHFMGAPDATRDDFNDMFTACWWRWEDIPYQDPSVPKAITRLTEIADVTIVTGNRNNIIEDGKARWLTHRIHTTKEIPEGIPVRSVGGDGRQKYKLDYDVFIDDCPHIAVGASRLAKDAILYDRPWNRGVGTETFINRVSSLEMAVLMVELLTIKEHEKGV